MSYFERTEMEFEEMEQNFSDDFEAYTRNEFEFIIECNRQMMIRIEELTNTMRVLAMAVTKIADNTDVGFAQFQTMRAIGTETIGFRQAKTAIATDDVDYVNPKQQ